MGWIVGIVLASAGIGVAVWRDVVARRAIAEQQRLRELHERRADLIASVTHELKTPLTSLLGYASILRRRDATLDPDQRDEFFEIMDRQGQRIVQLIEQLLQSSRVDAGLPRLQRVHVDLAAIANDVAREMGPGRGRAIEVAAPAEDLGLYGDPAALEHVLTNLLDNAIKYSGADTIVRVEIVETDGAVLLMVRDEGFGIPAAELPAIFDRFQQASNARGSASVGLGLHIVRSLVEAQGGSVAADSEVDKGTTVTVTLPRRRAR